jgi:hypothetical protein
MRNILLCLFTVVIKSIGETDSWNYETRLFGDLLGEP